MSRIDEPRPVGLFLISESAQDRSERVEEIRKHLSAGSYEVPAGDVAAALVAFFSRDFPADDACNTGFGDKSC